MHRFACLEWKQLQTFKETVTCLYLQTRLKYSGMIYRKNVLDWERESNKRTFKNNNWNAINSPDQLSFFMFLHFLKNQLEDCVISLVFSLCSCKPVKNSKDSELSEQNFLSKGSVFIWMFAVQSVATVYSFVYNLYFSMWLSCSWWQWFLHNP